MSTGERQVHERVEISPEIIRLSFDLTADDLAAHYRAYVASDPENGAARKKYGANYRAFIAMCVLAGLGAAAMVLISFKGVPEGAGKRTLLGVGATAICVFSYFMAHAHRHALTQMHRNGTMTAQTLGRESQFHTGAHRMELSAEGVSYDSADARMRQLWSGIADVRQTDTSIFVMRRDRLAYIIPKRLFATPEQADETLNRCRGWLDGQGHGDTERVRAWLEAHDERCPRCLYSLRGGTGRSCPECGHEFSVEFIAKLASRGEQNGQRA
jgi:hypothetical protein